MRLYVCCPDSGCGAYQSSLNWLKSQGIEPSLGHDGDHYFEFSLPPDWSFQRRIDFSWDLAHRTTGMVLCRCGQWLEEGHEGEVIKTECRNCGKEYLFCKECFPEEEWEGCDCDSAAHDSKKSPRTVKWSHPSELTDEQIEQQEHVDSAIHAMLTNLSGRELAWDISMIGAVRDCVAEEFQCRGLMTEKEFYPYIETGPAPDLGKEDRR